MVPTDSDLGSLNAINALPVDQYVKGVIPNESPSTWPQAALRAQAIVSRSYALSVQVHGNGFDLYDDTASQVYKGLESETAATNLAAEATKGAGGHLRRQGRRNLLLRLLRAATPRASRTSSSAPPSPTWSASPTPTTAPARCTAGRWTSPGLKSAPGSAPISTGG